MSLEKKIELNSRINENLEQQAGSLYQTYFSPKSNTQGEVVTLDKYCGKKNANASVEGGKYKFFTCAPDSLQIDSFIYDCDAIRISGNGAYTGRTRFYSGKFDIYQRTYACTLLDEFNSDFIFPLYWFVKLELSQKIMGGTRGSAIPYIVMNDLAKFEFLYNKEVFAEYMPLFKYLTKAIQSNEFENEQLSQVENRLAITQVFFLFHLQSIIHKCSGCFLEHTLNVFHAKNITFLWGTLVFFAYLFFFFLDLFLT